MADKSAEIHFTETVCQSIYLFLFVNNSKPQTGGTKTSEDSVSKNLILENPTSIMCTTYIIRSRPTDSDLCLPPCASLLPLAFPRRIAQPSAVRAAGQVQVQRPHGGPLHMVVERQAADPIGQHRPDQRADDTGRLFGSFTTHFCVYVMASCIKEIHRSFMCIKGRFYLGLQRRVKAVRILTRVNPPDPSSR